MTRSAHRQVRPRTAGLCVRAAHMGAAVAALALVAGCEQRLPPMPPGVSVDFRADEPTAFDPSAALQPLLAPPPELASEQARLLAEIRQSPDRFLRVRPPTAVLNEAELVFFAAGHTLELMTFYAEAVDRGVVDLRPRLAWLLERGGLHDAALAAAETAVRERPEDAEAHFVLGFVLGQSDTAGPELLRRIGIEYARATELEPDFVGPGGVTAAELRRQVAEIDARLGTPRPQ